MLWNQSAPTKGCSGQSGMRNPWDTWRGHPRWENTACYNIWTASARVTQQGIPVPAQIDLRVVVARVNFVYWNQLAMSREGFEETARSNVSFEDQILALGFLHIVTHLQSRGSRAKNKVLIVGNASFAFFFITFLLFFIMLYLHSLIIFNFSNRSFINETFFWAQVPSIRG